MNKKEHAKMKPASEYELVRKNRFHVNFPEKYGIEPWWVVSIDSDFKGNVTIIFRDNGAETQNALKKLRGNQFDVEVNLIKFNGDTMYKERYINCTSVSLKMDELTYDTDELRHITLKLNYGDKIAE